VEHEKDPAKVPADTARSREDDTRNARRNANRNPEWWGDFSHLQVQMGARQRGTAPKLPRAISVGPNACGKNSRGLCRYIPLPGGPPSGRVFFHRRFLSTMSSS